MTMAKESRSVVQSNDMNLAARIQQQLAPVATGAQPPRKWIINSLPSRLGITGDNKQRSGSIIPLDDRRNGESSSMNQNVYSIIANFPSGGNQWQPPQTQPGQTVSLDGRGSSRASRRRRRDSTGSINGPEDVEDIDDDSGAQMTEETGSLGRDRGQHSSKRRCLSTSTECFASEVNGRLTARTSRPNGLLVRGSMQVKHLPAVTPKPIQANSKTPQAGGVQTETQTAQIEQTPIQCQPQEEVSTNHAAEPKDIADKSRKGPCLKLKRSFLDYTLSRSDGGYFSRQFAAAYARKALSNYAKRRHHAAILAMRHGMHLPWMPGDWPDMPQESECVHCGLLTCNDLLECPRNEYVNGPETGGSYIGIKGESILKRHQEATDLIAFGAHISDWPEIELTAADRIALPRVEPVPRTPSVWIKVHAGQSPLVDKFPRRMGVGRGLPTHRTEAPVDMHMGGGNRRFEQVSDWQRKNRNYHIMGGTTRPSTRGSVTTKRGERDYIHQGLYPPSRPPARVIHRQMPRSQQAAFLQQNYGLPMSDEERRGLAPAEYIHPEDYRYYVYPTEQREIYEGGNYEHEPRSPPIDKSDDEFRTQAADYRTGYGHKYFPPPQIGDNYFEGGLLSTRTYRDYDEEDEHPDEQQMFGLGIPRYSAYEEMDQFARGLHRSTSIVSSVQEIGTIAKSVDFNGPDASWPPSLAMGLGLSNPKYGLSNSKQATKALHGQQSARDNRPQSARDNCHGEGGWALNGQQPPGSSTASSEQNRLHARRWELAQTSSRGVEELGRYHRYVDSRRPQTYRDEGRVDGHSRAKTGIQLRF